VGFFWFGNFIWTNVDAVRFGEKSIFFLFS
jgi:hypothetical protein